MLSQHRRFQEPSEEIYDDDKASCTSFCKELGFWIFFYMFCLACGSFLLYRWMNGENVTVLMKNMSIPIVSVFFTWAHIWLAVQMMFYPVKFFGIWNYKQSGYGLGWQGVVPRKAGVMAEKSCDLMLGSLITMEEIVDRFNMDEFFDTLGTVMTSCQIKVNEGLGEDYFPSLWPRIPKSVKDEITRKVLETQHNAFTPIMADVRKNIKEILNLKDMAVKKYTENPMLLINLFQQVGHKEFLFIRRTGAEMGLFLGFAQMGLFFATKAIPDKHIQDYAPFIVLPLSGLIIGNLTNYLAIKMIFRPLRPHLLCCGRINIQGLFLKRQAIASKKLASMLTDSCVNADMMIQFLLNSPGYQTALDIFRRNTEKACDDVLGRMSNVVGMTVGNEKWQQIKGDVVIRLAEEMGKHAGEFTKYVDEVLRIEDTIAERLAELPPEKFEGMLHPAFEEDEWMLIVLGGVLGVIVGVFQALVLGQ